MICSEILSCKSLKEKKVFKLGKPAAMTNPELSKGGKAVGGGGGGKYQDSILSIRSVKNSHAKSIKCNINSSATICPCVWVFIKSS